MTILVAGSTSWDDRVSIATELRGYDDRTRVLHRNRPGADRLASGVAASYGYRTEVIDHDIVAVLERLRPDSFLVFGTSWPPCRSALVAASKAGIRTRLVKG